MKLLRAIDCNESKGVKTISNKGMSLNSRCKPSKTSDKAVFLRTLLSQGRINGTRQGDVIDVASHMMIHIKR